MGINGKTLVSRVGELSAAIPDALVNEVEKLPDRLAGTEEVARLVDLLTKRCVELTAIF